MTNSDHIAEARVLAWNFNDHLVIAVKRKKVTLRIDNGDVHINGIVFTLSLISYDIG